MRLLRAVIVMGNVRIHVSRSSDRFNSSQLSECGRRRLATQPYPISKLNLPAIISYSLYFSKCNILATRNSVQKKSMATIRLLNVSSLSLETYPLENHLPYLAASHTWSENVFPFDQNPNQFFASFGGRGIQTVIQNLYPHIRHCWIDTLCIDQNDESDKLDQIPLMGQIFGQAEAVVIFTSAALGATQAEVDSLFSKLEGALAMCQADAWSEEGDN